MFVHISVHENVRDRQRRCRAKQKKAAQRAVDDSQYLVPFQSRKVIRELNRASKVILDAIKDFLCSFLEVVDRQVVMQKVWLDPYTSANVLKKLKFSKDAVLQSELLNGVRQSLEEMKCLRSAGEQATKNAILRALFTSSHNTLAREMG